MHTDPSEHTVAGFPEPLTALQLKVFTKQKTSLASKVGALLENEMFRRHRAVDDHYLGLRNPPNPIPRNEQGCSRMNWLSGALGSSRLAPRY